MGTLSGAGFSKVALISEPIKDENEKKFILFNIFSFIYDWFNRDKFAFHG